MPTTILVIDDDPSIVHLLKEDLETEGYRVLEGYDGKTALQIAARFLPHLIILDLNMPEMGGAQVLERLRQQPDTARIPVLFLTGEATNQLPDELASVSRVSHLTKPIELDRLNSVVKKLVLQYSHL